MGKFSKLLDDDTILRIWGSCDCDGGKLGEKNRGWKKKSGTSVQFFQPWFLSPNFLHRNCRALKFAILCLSPTFLKICFQLIFVIQSPPPITIAGPSNLWLRMGRGLGGEWMTKIATKKNQRLRIWPTFLWHLPTFSWTVWQSRSASFDVIRPLCLSSTPGLLSCSTRLLHRFGQATCSLDAPLKSLFFHHYDFIDLN